MCQIALHYFRINSKVGINFETIFGLFFPLFLPFVIVRVLGRSIWSRNILFHECPYQKCEIIPLNIAKAFRKFPF